MDIEKTIEFILQSQARAEARADKADMRADKAEMRADRTEKRLDAIDKKLDATAKLIRTGMKLLVSYQKETDARINALIDSHLKLEAEMKAGFAEMKAGLAELRKVQRATEVQLQRFIKSLERGGRNGRNRN